MLSKLGNRLLGLGIELLGFWKMWAPMVNRHQSHKVTQHSWKRQHTPRLPRSVHHLQMSAHRRTHVGSSATEKQSFIYHSPFFSHSLFLPSCFAPPLTLSLEFLFHLSSLSSSRHFSSGHTHRHRGQCVRMKNALYRYTKLSFALVLRTWKSCHHDGCFHVQARL